MHRSRGQMLCSKCGQFNASGTFCTSCGNALQGQETSETQFAAVQKVDTNKKTILIVGVVAGALVIGLVGFLVLRPSPAVPYLKGACAALTEELMEDMGNDDKESVVNRAEPQIRSALAADPELAAPFTDIIPGIEDSMDLSSQWARWMALYISSSSFFSSIYLNNAREVLDDLSVQNSLVQSQIDRACTEYN